MSTDRDFDKLGRYEIIRELGKGAMGVVYEGRDPNIERRVAIKTARRDALEPPHAEEMLQRFLREAKAAGQLRHPNIITIYDAGQQDDIAYIAMEYLEGGDLRTLLRRRATLHPEQIAEIGASICDALACAHESGIIHRDIKPANILVTEDGTLKIADFGIAHVQDSTLTESGVRIGTPLYMSPEQAMGDGASVASDLFAAGVILYEFLTGDSRAAITVFQGEEEKLAPPHLVDARVPEALSAVVLKALSRKPGDRYQSGRGMAVALRESLCPNPDPIRLGLDLESEAFQKPDSHKMKTVPGTPPPGVQAFPAPPAKPPDAPVNAGGAEGEKPARAAGPARRSRRALLVSTLVLAVAAVLLAVVAPRLLPGTGDEPVLAAATAKMDTEDWSGAAAAYEAVVAKAPENEQALFGFSLALMELGHYGEAEKTIQRLKDKPLHARASAMLAFKRNAPDARAALEQAAGPGAPYLEVLLARAEFAEGDYEGAAKRLADRNQAEFLFAYQYRDALQLLGQTYYQLQENEKAEETFKRLAALGGSQDKTVARRYMSLLEQRMNEARRQAATAMARQLGGRIQAGEYTPVEDTWSSRPLTFFVLPSKTTGADYGIETGLHGLFGSMLGNALDRETPLNLVNRDIINEVLAEQQLSAALSTRGGQIALGRVLGARVAVQGEFAELAGKERLRLDIVDIETTESVPCDSVPLAPGSDPETVIQEARDAIADAIQSAYPLRGRLYAGDNGPEVNIGANLGLEEGMRFKVLPEPGARTNTPLSAVVEAVRADTAAVTLQGLSPEDLAPAADSPWVVEQALDPARA